MDTQGHNPNVSPSLAPKQLSQSAETALSIMSPASGMHNTAEISPPNTSKDAAVPCQSSSHHFSPLSNVGKFFVIKGPKETLPEDKWAQDVLKAIPSAVSLRAHLIGVYDEVQIDGRDYFLINTVRQPTHMSMK